MTESTLFLCPKWQTKSMRSPCADRAALALKGPKPGQSVDFSYCLTCPDSVVKKTTDKSLDDERKEKRRRKGKYSVKPETHRCEGACGKTLPFTSEYFPKQHGYKWQLSYICLDCLNAHRREMRKGKP